LGKEKHLTWDTGKAYDGISVHQSAARKTTQRGKKNWRRNREGEEIKDHRQAAKEGGKRLVDFAGDNAEASKLKKIKRRTAEKKAERGLFTILTLEKRVQRRNSACKGVQRILKGEDWGSCE